MITKIIKIRELKKTRNMLHQFKELDEDNSGELSLEEFLQLTSSQIEFEQMTREQMEKAFRGMDSDNSDCITWDEFKEYYIKMVKSAIKTQDPYPMTDMSHLDSRYKQLRKRAYLVLFGGDSVDENKVIRQVFPQSEWIGSFLAFCVLLSTVAFMCETVKDWENYEAWDIIEYVVTGIFTLEFFVRLAVVRHRKYFLFS